MSKNAWVVSLVGNPNCGKTTLFNQLTGQKQKTGNWAGVTVKPHFGHCQLGLHQLELVDLPGCHDFALDCETSLDEQAAQDYLCSDRSNVMINVIDASNLERSLYLTLQLIEKKTPLIVVLNMVGTVERKGIQIDAFALQKQLGCPVVPVQSLSRKGLEPLKQQLHTTLTRLQENKGAPFTPESWCSLVEPLETLAIKERFDRIQDIVQSVTHRTTVQEVASFSEKLDHVILNRFLAIPIFLVVMYGVFMFSVHLSGLFSDFFEFSSQAIFVDGVHGWLVQWGAPEWLIGFFAYGVGQGITITVSFIPVIAGMFFALTFLESSGYMARAAFVMDKLMRWIGLPGKSFVPMIMGFGCNVPAVMATRTLESYQERILTVLMTPFMSCGARLAIYALFAAAFFPHSGPNLIFALYFIGIGVALLTAFILKKTLLRGSQSPLLMELPLYRWPGLGLLCRTTWHRVKRFLLKAGLLIVPLCAIIGTLFAVQPGQQNVVSVFGRHLTPVFSPMGIEEENWPATVGLLTGVLAKEVVVGTLNALYLEEARKEPLAVRDGLEKAVMSIPHNWSKLKEAFRHPIMSSMKAQEEIEQGVSSILVLKFGSIAAAFSYLLFVLLYMPCVSVIATIARELRAAWAIFAVLWTTGIAYATAVLFYQGAQLLSSPSIASLNWIVGILVVLAASIGVMRQVGRKLERRHRRVPTEISFSQ